MDNMECEDEKNGANSEKDPKSDADDSSDETSQMEERAAELEASIEANAYYYDAHKEVVDLYCKLCDINSMRAAYQRFAKLYPLTEDLWLNWIKTEIRISTKASEQEKIQGLFKTALNDYLSIRLWREYLQFSIGVLSASDTRKLFEEAVSKAGIHIVDGRLIWDMYREFEMAHLSLLVPKDDNPAWTEQATCVINLYKRQLTIPLLTTDETHAEFKQWAAAENLPPEVTNMEGIERTLRSNKKLLDLYKKHEDELLAGKTDEEKMHAYRSYVKEVKNPTHVVCLYERAIAEFCLYSDLWAEYLRYLDRNGIPTEEAAERSLRNCPWAEDLWIVQVQAMEKSALADVTSKFEQGLKAISPAKGLDLWLCYLEHVTRREELTYVEKREVFQQAKNYVQESDAEFTISRFEARFAANNDDLPAAKKVFESEVLKYEKPKRSADFWLEYANVVRRNGTVEEVRNVFRKAAEAVRDRPRSVCSEWKMFERECGTLESSVACSEKCAAAIAKLPKIDAAEPEEKRNQAAQNGKRRRHEQQEEVPRKKAKVSEAKKPIAKAKLDVQALDPATTVFVSNMRQGVSEQRLRGLFPSAKRIDLTLDAYGKSRGHGYILFSSPQEVADALKRDRELIDNRPLFISPFKPAKEERPQRFSYEKEENKLFVKNLPLTITQQRMEEIFREFGPVQVRLLLQKPSGRPKGLAFVEYGSKEEADTALRATDNLEVEGHRISVAISAPPPKANASLFGGPSRSLNRLEPKSRLFIPRVLSTNKVASPDVSTANSGSRPSTTLPKSNEDFRNMLLGKKK